MVTENDLPPGLQEAVFALPENGLSGPLESPFGWHLFRVKAVIAGGTQSLDDVREELTRILKLEHAGDSVFELANALQDALAGGATLEEAATNLGLRPRRVEALDRAGTDVAGAAVADLPDPRTFVATAFEAERGIESDLVETDRGSYYILRVDKITAPALRPLESVRKQVADAWRAARRGEAASAKAEEAAEKLRGGDGMAAVAAELGFETRLTPALTRIAAQGDPAISATVLSALFGLALGEVTTGPSAAGDAHVVASLKTVETPSADADALAMKRITEELSQGLAVDVLTQYRAALEKAYKIEINQLAIDALLGLGPS
jgi:peptidyl-prolyl cis-trans isomerase D